MDNTLFTEGGLGFFEKRALNNFIMCVAEPTFRLMPKNADSVTVVCRCDTGSDKVEMFIHETRDLSAPAVPESHWKSKFNIEPDFAERVRRKIIKAYVELKKKIKSFDMEEYAIVFWMNYQGYYKIKIVSTIDRNRNNTRKASMMMATVPDMKSINKQNVKTSNMNNFNPEFDG